MSSLSLPSAQPGAAAQAGQGPAARPPRRGPAGRRARRRARARRAAEADGRPARRRARARLPGWTQLKVYVERVAAHGPDLRARLSRGPRLLRGPRVRPARVRPRRHPGRRRGVRTLGRPLTEAGARAVVARRHGFASWAALRRHVADLRASGEPFARAYRAVEARDSTACARCSTAPPSWPRRGTNGNDLLGMAGATGDARLVRAAARARRRPHPRQRPRLDAAAPGGLQAAAAGADAARRGRADRHLRSRRRRHAARDRPVLGPSGAPRTGRARACTGQPAGRRRARADRHDRRPGRARRALAPAAGAHRGFYRPHGGFPYWKPADDPQEVLDEALAWAARGNRAEAVGRSWNAARTSRPTSTAARR